MHWRSTLWLQSGCLLGHTDNDDFQQPHGCVHHRPDEEGLVDFYTRAGGVDRNSCTLKWPYTYLPLLTTTPVRRLHGRDHLAEICDYRQYLHIHHWSHHSGHCYLSRSQRHPWRPIHCRVSRFLTSSTSYLLTVFSKHGSRFSLHGCPDVCRRMCSARGARSAHRYATVRYRVRYHDIFLVIHRPAVIHRRLTNLCPG